MKQRGLALQARISRALVTILALSLFTFGAPGSELLSSASAASVTTGGCTVDATNSSNLQVMDSLTADGTCIVRFITGTSSFVLPTEVNSIRTLAVAGGGGGGFGGNGGAGGAGAVIYSTSGISVASGATISATIGSGGAGGINDSDPTNQSYWSNGFNGNSTTLTIAGSSFIASGGGGGGGNTDYRGSTGGSGGGSAASGTSSGSGSNVDYLGWSEAVNAGYKAASAPGGGGGGAGAAATSGNGAIGITILGYKVGGGGAGWSAGTNTLSAPFGGGAPRNNSGYLCPSGTCNGVTNTGGGGGGGGNGGSGVALVKFVPASGQGAIVSSGSDIIGRTRTFVFTRTTAASTGITVTYQWQRKPSGSSTWSNVSGGTGATAATFTTAALTSLDSASDYRVAVIDTNATLGISTTTYTSVGSSVIPYLDTDYSLSLDGSSQYATAADDDAFDLTGSFTFEAWIYATDVSTYKMIASKENSYWFYIANGFYTLSIDGANSVWSVASSNVPAVPNEWHHIAYAKLSSSANYTLYLDGVPVYVGAADTLGTATAVNTTEDFMIGSRAGATNQKFIGKIDNVALFSTVRTEAQIKADMQGHISGGTTGLKYYFDFNESTGSTVYNHAIGATGSNDLVVVGSAPRVDVKTVDTTSQPAYTQVIFTRTYINALGGWLSPNTSINYGALVVAGGGAGGARVSTGAGGGGGAGGMIEALNRTLESSTLITPVIGQGGLGSRTGTMSTIATGDNGQNTLLKFASTTYETWTAIGGGGGAAGYTTDTNSYNGNAGGSGGGASGSNLSGYSGGATTQTSGSGYTGYGNVGGNNAACSNSRAAGGGGGAGAAGASVTNCSYSGNGGAGRLSQVTGTYYAGGGGGGDSGDNNGAALIPGTGGIGGGADGSAGSPVGGSAEYVGFNATPNTGGGGGGVGISSDLLRGGAGGSGIIVIKYLTAAIPMYSGPFNDTTTAGLSYTFHITGDAPAPFVRTYLWQSSTDTGTTWSNISVGAGIGTADYTTPVLETTTSGSRYQYRVVVTDTDTGSVLTDTSTAAYLIIVGRLTMTGTYTIMKYGVGHTDTFTVDSKTGAGTKTIRRTSTAKPNISWDTSTANIAVLTISAALLAGTYYDTLTVTDQSSSTLLYPITIVVLKADTVTVTVANQNETYTASSLSYTDTYTAIGLVAGDSLTSVSYSYSGTANDGTIFTNSARPAIAGTYSIIPAFTLVNLSSYESVTVVNGTLTINRKSRSISINSAPTSLKYGDTYTVSASIVDGASDGTIFFRSNTTSLCSFSGAVLLAIEASGTCSFTATIGRGNNFDTATAASATATLLKADTLTVTVLPIDARVYTGYQTYVTPNISITGLKNSDTTTATAATFSFNSVTAPTSFTTVAPTLSDTYTVRAETLTLTTGLTSRYQAIIYQSSSMRINRAQQSGLGIAQYGATFGIPYKVFVYGGLGTGTITSTVSAGTATGCVISGDTVTTTTAGTCYLTATKSQDQNYETSTVSIYIYFLVWTPPVIQAVSAGPTIVISSEVTIVRDANAAPTISSIGPSGNSGFPVAINGAGFSAATADQTTIKYWRNQEVSGSSNIQIKSDTLIWAKQAPSATVGKVLLVNPNGSALSPESFEPLPINIG